MPARGAISPFPVLRAGRWAYRGHGGERASGAHGSATARPLRRPAPGPAPLPPGAAARRARARGSASPAGVPAALW